MRSALARWQPAASQLATVSVRSRARKGSGMAVFSLLLAPTFVWPKTSECAAAQALTTQMPLFLAPAVAVPRSPLPSTFTARNASARVPSTWADQP